MSDLLGKRAGGGLIARRKREWKHLSEQERSEEHLKKENG